MSSDEAAHAAIATGVEVESGDAADEMLALLVKLAAAETELKKSTTGALGSIVKQHASTMLVTEATVWVGSVPETANSVPETSNKTVLMDAFSPFGDVVSATFRSKPGSNKSWALVTFREVASVDSVLQATVSVKDASGVDVTLRIARANLEQITDGSLSQISKEHEQAVKSLVVLGVQDVSAKKTPRVPAKRPAVNRRAKLTDVWTSKRSTRGRSVKLSETRQAE